MTPAPSGEEWKQLDSATAHYDPRKFSGELDAARDRIRRLRCQDADLLLVDRAGRPIPNLRVEVVQTRSAFQWGEQLWSFDTLLRHGHAESARARHFTRRFTECLNSANCLSYWTEAPRNDGPKHMEFQGEDHLDEFQAQVDWALAHGLTPKGHPVFWTCPKAYPEWLGRYSMETQWKFIEVRVRNLIARFKGKVKLWDLVNEPMWEPAPKNIPQRHWPHLESLEDICEYIVPILRWAREEDPEARYIINDYGMELDSASWSIRDKDGRPVTAKGQRDRFTALLRRLSDQGAAPDALGMQAHTGQWLTPSTQNAMLDDFATSGVPLHYTEFWADHAHLLKAGMDHKIAEEMKADYVANIMTVAFAHPSVDAFYFWGEIGKSMGFREDHNSNGLPTSSHNPTPTYWRVQQLLRTEWMTRESLVSDADGRVRFRGFLGDYALRYQIASDMPAGVNFDLSAQTPGPRRLVLHRPRG
ncbi:MAG: endo-1,4-beta-xylanase [Opitutaceae bacterium]|nr:endo-1,4-beta-xylanase [Opitutaceae bacterium]